MIANDRLHIKKKEEYISPTPEILGSKTTFISWFPTFLWDYEIPVALRYWKENLYL